MNGEAQYLRWFETIDHNDLALVGGKNASLGEMYQSLTDAGVPVPNGFALTTALYRRLLSERGVKAEIEQALAGLDVDDVSSLSACGRACREALYDAPFPVDVADAIGAAEARLVEQYGDDVRLAVRSSATAEDLPDASFAGQHDSFLNVARGQALIDACRHCLASLFTDRAIRYRHDRGFDHLKVALSVSVMKMVRADQGAAGVIFTIDTESGHTEMVLLTSAYGLGENVVQGTVDPDEFYVHKPTFRTGHRCVLKRKLGAKQQRMVCGRRRLGSETFNEATPEALRQQYSISDDEVLALADHALTIEDHYSRLAGKPVPMDIEWARDGTDGRLYIVQARPETVASRQDSAVLIRYRLQEKATARVSGRAVGSAIATGRARVVSGSEDLRHFQPGEILVAETTAPDWGTVIKQAAAVVTDRGGRTCHAAIVARELGIPAVVGCETATKDLATGEEVTVSCAEGETGKVFPGLLAFDRETHQLNDLTRPRTQIMMNVGNPEQAFRAAHAAQRWRWSRSSRVHHHGVHRHPPDGAGAPGEDQ